MKTITHYLVVFVKRYLPDPFSLALLLSIIVFFMGVFGMGVSPTNMMVYWGKGFFGITSFTMQMIMILFAGYALAISAPVTKLLKAVTSIPKNRTQALIFTFVASYICGYINWGFGLVAAALIAKEIAIKFQGQGVDFPLLVAAAYAATQLPALSSAILLIIATEGHFLEASMGIVPWSRTLFSPMNITITLANLFAVCVILKFMNPSKGEAVEVDGKLLQEEVMTAKQISNQEKKVPNTPAEWLDQFSFLIYFVAAFAIYYIYDFFATKGFNPDTNTVILIFITLGMLVHRTPSGYVKAVNESIKICGGIALLFPFYYGIMGMMANSGSAAAISQWFISISTVETFPLLAFLSAGIVNLFIPSGGGQWAVQGPIMVEAAQGLGIDMAKVALAVCWGDLWTNLIQPFWAIPVLAIAKLDVKDIMGYCAVIGIVEGIIISAGFLIF